MLTHTVAKIRNVSTSKLPDVYEVGSRIFYGQPSEASARKLAKALGLSRWTTAVIHTQGGYTGSLVTANPAGGWDVRASVVIS